MVRHKSTQPCRKPPHSVQLTYRSPDSQLLRRANPSFNNATKYWNFVSTRKSIPTNKSLLFVRLPAPPTQLAAFFNSSRACFSKCSTNGQASSINFPQKTLRYSSKPNTIPSTKWLTAPTAFTPPLTRLPTAFKNSNFWNATSIPPSSNYNLLHPTA
ncbi:unnamed protein product [Anisakis simplex]|uniref:Ovule protein n=1 Tax=Anisakis simplex TaxID=6269 RepID=A0A0M3J786_ANISI|nr:unnamed protein product [Anisakis simplex]